MDYSFETLHLPTGDGAGTVRLKIIDEPTPRSAMLDTEEFRRRFSLPDVHRMALGGSVAELNFGLAAALAQEEIRLPQRYWPE